MAKTLAEYKKEFAALQPLVRAAGDDIEEVEHNLESFREQMNEGFNVLGARIAELRTQGQTGDKLEDYLADNEVKSMVRELTQRREAAKVAAAKGEQLHKTTKPAIVNRMTSLREALAAEITAREKKFTSKALGLNQSVKEMKPLQAEIEKYCKGGNADFTTLFNFKGTYSAAQFDRLYTTLLNEQLQKSVKQVRATEKDAKVTQALNDKVMNGVILKVRNAAAAIVRQGQAGQAAQKAKDVQALSTAKTTAGQSLELARNLVAPYEKIMKSSKVQARLAHSPDKPLIDKNYQTMRELLAKAEDEYETLRGRTLAQ